MNNDIVSKISFHIVSDDFDKARKLIESDAVSGQGYHVCLSEYNGEITIELSAKTKSESVSAADSEDSLAPAAAEIRAAFGDDIYTENGCSLAETVVRLLTERGKSVATAESCTGGLVSKLITDVSGASKVFSMGITAYTASVKERVLGVPHDLIDREGTVSPTVAEYMAEGARVISGSTYGIGITGVAGGMTENKPSGLVYVSVSDGVTEWTRQLMIGDGSGEQREYVCNVAATTALDMLRRSVIGIAENGQPVNLSTSPDSLTPTATG